MALQRSGYKEIRMAWDAFMKIMTFILNLYRKVWLLLVTGAAARFIWPNSKETIDIALRNIFIISVLFISLRRLAKRIGKSRGSASPEVSKKEERSHVCDNRAIV
jgi:hypothetical protein